MQKSSTTNATHAIAYYRRSTSHSQKHSLEAQQNYVEDFCTKEGITIVASFEETFTGKEMNRPEFNKALEMARKQKIPIIIKSLSPTHIYSIRRRFRIRRKRQINNFIQSNRSKRT